MATSAIKQAPVRNAPTKPERQAQSRATAWSRFEDTVDRIAVQRSRQSAAERGEQPIAWAEFKKKLGR